MGRASFNSPTLTRQIIRSVSTASYYHNANTQQTGGARHALRAAATNERKRTMKNIILTITLTVAALCAVKTSKSQRDFDPKPSNGVARNELPWVNMRGLILNPNGV